jgi:hypothetical protein
MKKTLYILFCIISTLISAQNYGSYILYSVISNERTSAINQVQSNCASPDANSTVITFVPTYAQLQTDGYCITGSYGKNGTVCWSLTPSTNSVSINTGYATTGCFSTTFSNPTLYTCAPSCVNQGVGINFSVIPGNCYTWCLTYSGAGGGCVFNDFCPYWTEEGPVLPIELLYFVGSNKGELNVLQWKTEIEIINDYFSIEISTNGIDWSVLKEIKGAGTTNVPKKYIYSYNTFKNTINYYRLKQVDFNGNFKYFGIITIDNSNMEKSEIIHTYNILGQEVDADYQGLVLIYYNNGSVIKKVNN